MEYCKELVSTGRLLLNSCSSQIINDVLRKQEETRRGEAAPVNEHRLKAREPSPTGSESSPGSFLLQT